MKSALVVSLISLSVLAHEHREHGAHQHGAGKMGIAFDGKAGKIDFKIASESIFGFEHEAKSAADKKRKTEGLKLLETKMSEMVSFEKSLNCVITTEKIEVLQEKKSSHSDTAASYNVTCEKSPAGSELVFNFQSVFPKIRDLDVDVVVDNLQKSIEAKANGTKIQLK